jgi:MFS family permease
MAFAFYVVYAVRYHGMSEYMAGIMTSVLFITQVVSNPALGQLADRWSRKHVMEIGALAITISALLAWQAPDLSWFYLVFILAGSRKYHFLDDQHGAHARFRHRR